MPLRVWLRNWDRELAGVVAETTAIGFQRPRLGCAAELSRQSSAIFVKWRYGFAFPVVPVRAQEPAIFAGTIAAGPIERELFGDMEILRIRKTWIRLARC